MGRSYYLCYTPLHAKNFLLVKNYLLKNVVKIILSTILMAFLLIFALDNYANYLEYTYNYKLIYLMLIVGFVAVVYLILCYLGGVLKIKNFKIN